MRISTTLRRDAPQVGITPTPAQGFLFGSLVTSTRPPGLASRARAPHITARRAPPAESARRRAGACPRVLRDFSLVPAGLAGRGQSPSFRVIVPALARGQARRWLSRLAARGRTGRAPARLEAFLSRCAHWGTACCVLAATRCSENIVVLFHSSMSPWLHAARSSGGEPSALLHKI